MKATVNFSIGCRALYPRPREADGIFVGDEALFHRIMELTGCTPRRNPAFIIVELPLQHRGLPEALRIIRDQTGRVPIPHRIPRGTGEPARYFYVRVFREYEEKDVRHLPYVVVHCRREIGDFLDQTQDERYVAEANSRLKACSEYGSLRFHPAYAMSTKLKELLERERMKGFHPRPVLFDKPDKVAKELWQPWSDVVMPRCLLPLVDNVGEPTTLDTLADPTEYTDRPRDPGRGVHYEGGPYIPEELCYGRAEVLQLGEFDIAIARERVGNFKRGAFRPLIISQRFRQVLKKEKLPGMQYNPIKLLKKGERLWENPFESMIGPYDEKPPVADP